jgi:hypothetical protein
LADTLFLPESTGRGQTIETLVGGLLMGGTVMLLPSALAPDAQLAGMRLALGSAMSIAGIVGFVVRRPGEPLPQNIAANRALREDWNERTDQIVEENANRITGTQLVIEAGPQRVVELRRR